MRTGPSSTSASATEAHRGGAKKRVYPACSQDPKIQKRTLGTSVGWSDIYPSSYYQNWINVNGLGLPRVRDAAVPDNYLFEKNEENNQARGGCGSGRAKGRVAGC